MLVVSQEFVLFFSYECDYLCNRSAPVPTMSEIKDRVIKTITKAPGLEPGEDLTASDSVLDKSFEELKLDSLDLVNIVYAIEEEFDIDVQDEQVYELRTLRDVIEGVEKLLLQKTQGPAGKAAAS